MPIIRTVKQWTYCQSQHLQNQKSIPTSCTSSHWHISNKSECWPILVLHL